MNLHPTPQNITLRILVNWQAALPTLRNGGEGRSREAQHQRRSHIWLQILADILQTELIAPSSEEGAAYGAAILAMVGVGAYPNLEAAFEILSQESNTVQPQVNPLYEQAFKKYELLYEALKAVR